MPVSLVLLHVKDEKGHAACHCPMGPPADGAGVGAGWEGDRLLQDPVGVGCYQGFQAAFVILKEPVFGSERFRCNP